MKYKFIAILISAIFIISLLGVSASYDYNPSDLTDYGSPWIDEYVIVDYPSNRHSNDGTAICECENGDILLALFNGSGESPGDGDDSYFYRSTDGGETWNIEGECPNNGDTNGLTTEMVTAPNGTITLFYWDFPYGNPCLYFNSFDNGSTWTSAKYVDSDGDHKEVYRIGGSFVDDKDVVWAYYMGQQGNPKTIWNSSDNGLTWDLVHTFNGGNSNSNWILSWYGDAVQLHNGTIMTINYGWGYDSTASTERQLAYRISEDYGKTWDNGDHWIYLAKQIRNPEMEVVGDHAFLFGRSGRWSGTPDRGVIYYCSDSSDILNNASWDSGTYIDSPTFGSAYYSNSRVLHHPDNVDYETPFFIYARPFGSYQADKYGFFIENITNAATSWWWEGSSSSDDNISFQSINNQENNSNLQDDNRTLVWNIVSDTTHYGIRVSNYSDFHAEIFLQLDNISLSEWGAEYYSEANGNVTFILPDQYNITAYSYHYYQVRAYTT